MKFKKFLALTIAFLLTISLCACGKVTAESLIADMAKAVMDIKAFSGTMDMEMEYGIGIAGEKMDMAMSVYADVAYSENTTYMNGAVTTEASGADTATAVLESYTVTEDETVTSYTLSDGTWYKMEIDKPEMDMGAYLNVVTQLISPENRGEIVLLEETDTYNDREVYVLNIADCNYPELAMDTVFTQFEEILGEVDFTDVDFSAIVMDVTLKVYKDTKLPAQLTIDYGDSLTLVIESLMDVIIDSMKSQLTGVDGVDLDAVFDGLELSMEIPKSVTTICFNEYNIDPIVIPEEALAADELIEEESGGLFDNLLLGAGNEDGGTDESTGSAASGYTVLYSEDGKQSVGLGEIEGVAMLADYTDDFNVYYEYSSDTEYISYMFYFVSLDGYEPETLLEETVPGYEDYLAQFECENIVVSDVQTATIGGFEVTYVVFDYVLDYPSQDVLSIVTYNDTYGIAIETYTMTEGTIDPIVTLENGVGAIIK